MCNVKEQLKAAGFYKTSNAINSLCELGRKYSEKAHTEDSPFEAYPSFIATNSPTKLLDNVLTIDIGGTSTRAGIRAINGNNLPEWDFLFRTKNEEFYRAESSNDSFFDYCRQLVRVLKDRILAHGHELSIINSLGVVWSNAMDNKIVDKQNNVTGIVSKRELYTKNEWFIKDLKNSRDLGVDLKAAFDENGFTINKFLIANDTPLTFKSIAGAVHAGVVASTGLNGTLIKTCQELGITNLNYDNIICNGEIGGRFKIPDELLCPNDLIDPGVIAEKIEYISAGRFLPQIFLSHVLALESEILSELQSYFRSLGNKIFQLYRAKDLGLLISDKKEFLSRRNNPQFYNDRVLEILKNLAIEVLSRSALMTALTIYCSLANQFSKRDQFLVALDSRLANEMQFFWEELLRWTKAITPKGKQIEICLVTALEVKQGRQIEKISIPMLGAANALDTLII